MNILQTLCCTVIFIHILGATSTDCINKIYLSSNGFSCYPCPPGFYVDKECMENATNNKCKPCPTGEFHSTCAMTAKTCKECSSCPMRQKITRNCTSTKDNTCACKNENHYWDTLEHVCLNTCRRGKKITLGDEGEGLICVPCEADTWSNERNSRKCKQCSKCSAYKKYCTKTSDAVCNKHTTKTVTTESVTSPTTITDRLTSTTHPYRKGSSSTCEESNHGERDVLIAVSVLFALCFVMIVTVTVFIACKWLKISQKFPCCEKSRQKRNNNAEKKERDENEVEKHLLDLHYNLNKKDGADDEESKMLDSQSGENAATAHTDQQQIKPTEESEGNGTTTHNTASKTDAGGPIFSINPEPKPDLPTPGQKSFSI